MTLNFPHVMYYAPHVSNQDIGGAKPGSGQIRVALHGPHGYMIQGMGEAEKVAITKHYEEMLGKLCKLKELWCLPR